MIRHLGILSISTLLVACGGSGSTEMGYVSADIPNIGAATNSVLPSEARLLEADKDFAFETSQTIDINFDIAQARNEAATVTICTDYENMGNDFDVDFNSCTISGELSEGAFHESMEVTNDHEAVVAVVLFQDALMAPLYKVFNVENTFRTKQTHDNHRVIVWR